MSVSTPPPDFVNAVITTDAGVMVDASIDAMNATLAANGFPNWSPSDGDLAVIILGVVSQLAADVATVAATVVPAIFRAFGTQLFGLPYAQGTYASVTSTWGFTSPAPVGGYVIPAGTVVLVSGQQFYVANAYTSNVGDTSATVQLTASGLGATGWNGLGGVGQRAPLNQQLDWVTGGYCVLSGMTTGGTDQQSDAAYQTALAAVLALQSPRPIAASDFANLLLSPVCAQATGVVVGRATSVDGFYPTPRQLSTGSGLATLNVTTTNGLGYVQVNTPSSQVATIGAAVGTTLGVPAGTVVAASPAPTLTNFTMSQLAGAGAGTGNLTVSQTSGYAPVALSCVGSFTTNSQNVTILQAPYLGAIPYPGSIVTGAGIVPSTSFVLASPAPTTTGFTMTWNGTANESGIPITVSQWTSVMSCTTTFVTDANGNVLSPANMDALNAWLQTYRQLNFLAYVAAPTYTTIYVTAQVHVLPGANAPATAASVQAAVIGYLSPITWGTVRNAGWMNSGQGYNIVRLNSLMNIIENVSGVQYVPNGGLTLGTAASPVGVADITMLGTAPLPQATNVSVIVTAV